MSDESWKVFQADVLDVLRQYSGYFDFFERVGSLSDSRPDCFARLSRKDKKEIWVVDAKKKPRIDSEDRQRMEKYLDMIDSNPIDVGLELSELPEHKTRGIFVTPAGGSRAEKYESVEFPEFHQFLQKELVYTDTDRLVREVSKILERRQLSQEQARLLFEAIKPYERRVEEGTRKLEQLSTDFVGLELERAPIESHDYSIPVDAVLEHSAREQVFLFDVPYSRRALEDVEQKMDEIRSRMKEIDRPVYYSAIDTFSSGSREYSIQPEDLRQEIQEKAGIVSPDEIAELISPKIPVEREVGDSFIEIRESETGFRARVETRDDVNFGIEIMFPEKTVSGVRDHFLNTREIGEMDGRRLRIDFEVTEELEIDLGERTETYGSFEDAVGNLYSSAVNPVLGKEISRKV